MPNAWNKGKKQSYPAWNKGIFGAKSPHWKGDKVKYAGLHAWIRRHLGTPSFCEHCKTTTAKRFEWANISKKYTREFADWIRLCVSCHRKYDGHGIKRLKTLYGKRTTI